ncbi:MAG: CRISPR-associated endoribonuclease Cas6 [Candidatus Desulfofervidaceae bacterium]|nr:CRISPR-associated endoribonuclease Cas6 [Candidatus Desulfofervidaceae bacterium]MDL1970442.1 CRISPR-associated endoribonuclease Cas6 [Candidatus Desulfofervidaceae bacterium]
MHVEINLNAEGPFILPKSHNHILQGFIYSLLEPTLRKHLHQNGYVYGKRKFKLFTFSRLLGKVRNTKDGFEFYPPLRLVISSAKDEILQSLTEGLLKKENLFLYKAKIYLESINILPKPLFSKSILIKMLSPVTTYSTLRKLDGKKKVYYYSPFESEFNELIKENLRKKYELVFGKKLTTEFDFKISPKKVKPSDQKIIIYKGTVIKAWMGIYKLEGTPEVIGLSYDTGLGAKNSQGFGCWEKLS